jgi:hypothetical protein
MTQQEIANDLALMALTLPAVQARAVIVRNEMLVHRQVFKRVDLPVYARVSHHVKRIGELCETHAQLSQLSAAPDGNAIDEMRKELGSIVQDLNAIQATEITELWRYYDFQAQRGL